MANDIAAKHGSVYSLGHHDAERQRLTTQHEILLALLGEPPNCPIDPSKIKKIVDIGCGVNASVSLIFAKKFPNAQVYGVDLSPVTVSDPPPNLTFIEGNVLHLLGNDSRLAEGTVDLVFSRLLVSGMQDWHGHITGVSRLLAPGGWLEMLDIPDFQFYRNEDPEPVSKAWVWNGFMRNKFMSGPAKLDLTTFNRADEIMREAGLERCEKKVHRLPWEPAPKGLDPKVFGPGWQAWRGAYKRMVEVSLEGETEEFKTKTWEQMEEDTVQQDGVWFPFVGVWGRRPE